MKKASNRKSKLAFEENRPEVYSTLRAIAKQNKGNAAANQRERLSAALHKLGSLTTIECRKGLDILAPHARVHELRKRGMSIDTHMVYQETDCGASHRIGKYVLKTKGKK